MRAWSVLKYCARHRLLLFERSWETPPPSELTQFHALRVVHEVPLFWKQGLFRDAKDLGKEFNLLAVRWTAQRLYVCQDVAGHIYVSEQLQLGDQFILRPASLIAEPRHVSPDDICVFGHP